MNLVWTSCDPMLGYFSQTWPLRSGRPTKKKLKSKNYSSLSLESDSLWSSNRHFQGRVSISSDALKRFCLHNLDHCKPSVVIVVVVVEVILNFFVLSQTAPDDFDTTSLFTNISVITPWVWHHFALHDLWRPFLIYFFSFFVWWSPWFLFCDMYVPGNRLKRPTLLLFIITS